MAVLESAVEDVKPYPEAPASELETDGNARFHLAAIIESADDAIVSKDLQGVVKSWNQAAHRIFGYTAEDMIGRSILRLIPKALQYEEEEILSKLRAGKRIDHYETTRIRKDGEILDVSVTISPIKDGAGHVIGASKIVRDISDRKRIEQILIQSEKLAVTGRMAAMIAHEINNPLESVMNLVFLARQASPAEGKAHQYLVAAESELSHVAQIARQTLAFYRDAGTPVAVDLHELIETVLTVYDSKLLAAGISIERQFDDLQKIVVSKREMIQVFSNVIANAIDAMKRGGALHLSTRMVTGSCGDGIQSIIRDEGSGIDQKHLDKIYDPFFTTKGERGTGIGLWVTKQLVEKRGGLIAIASSIDAGNSGTTVTIFLPFASPATFPSRTGEAKIPM
jgi:PAS domain S-box-containing protein